MLFWVRSRLSHETTGPRADIGAGHGAAAGPFQLCSTSVMVMTSVTSVMAAVTFTFASALVVVGGARAGVAGTAGHVVLGLITITALYSLFKDVNSWSCLALGPFLGWVHLN